MNNAKSKSRAGGPRPGAGRPPGAVTLRRAIDRLGVDPADVDPARVLAAIAVDVKAPATARVQACRELLGLRLPPPVAPVEPKSEYELKWLRGDDE